MGDSLCRVDFLHTYMHRYYAAAAAEKKKKQRVDRKRSDSEGVHAYERRYPPNYRGANVYYGVQAPLFDADDIIYP